MIITRHDSVAHRVGNRDLSIVTQCVICIVDNEDYNIINQYGSH